MHDPIRTLKNLNLRWRMHLFGCIEPYPKCRCRGQELRFHWGESRPQRNRNSRRICDSQIARLNRAINNNGPSESVIRESSRERALIRTLTNS